MKFRWWHNISGKLTITGRRLDAAAPPLQAQIPEGYDQTGFQASTLIFPTEGCWEVIGALGDASLRFVTLVRKVSFEYAEPHWFPEGVHYPDDVDYKDIDLSDLPEAIRIHFGFSGEREGELVFETRNGIEKTSNTSPPDAQHSVKVNGQSGICVQGAFDAQQRWQNDADVTTLEWSDGTLSYRITQTGLGLTCDDLVRVATPS